MELLKKPFNAHLHLEDRFYERSFMKEKENMAKNFVLILLFFNLCVFCGCAHISEAGKKIWGTSIEHLERARATGKSFEVGDSLDNCFADGVRVLTDSGATVYLKDKNKSYFAAMNFKGYVDTTEVGVFFTQVSPGLIKVEVASMIPRLADEAAELLKKSLKIK